MQGYENEIVKIKSCITKGELPGLLSQLKMAPVTRLAEITKSQSTIERKNYLGKIPKKSAVLILLYPKNDSTHLVMMVRATDDTVHSGQVSFPGGKVEKNDHTISHTALRETHEEIGVIPESVEIIGKLTKLYIPPSNFDVFPVVGFTKNTPVFVTNDEVQKILEIDLTTLLNPSTCGYEKINHRTGNEFVVPCYYVHGEVVWGATAMILAELLDMIHGEFAGHTK